MVPNSIYGHGSFYQEVIFGADMLLFDSESRKTYFDSVKAILHTGCIFNFQGMVFRYHEF